MIEIDSWSFIYYLLYMEHILFTQVEVHKHKVKIKKCGVGIEIYEKFCVIH